MRLITSKIHIPDVRECAWWVTADGTGIMFNIGGYPVNGIEGDPEYIAAIRGQILEGIEMGAESLTLGGGEQS